MRTLCKWGFPREPWDRPNGHMLPKSFKHHLPTLSSGKLLLVTGAAIAILQVFKVTVELGRGTWIWARFKYKQVFSWKRRVFFFFQTKSFSDYFRPLINFQIFGKVGVSHFYLRCCCCCGGWDLHGISLRSGCLTSAAVIWFWKLSLGLFPSPSLVNHVFWKVLY